MKKVNRILVFLLSFVMIMSLISINVSAAEGKVSIYGTPEAAIKTGPVYATRINIPVSEPGRPSLNNVDYRIPQVSEHFELNEGWTIDYVYVAGNSAGQRQPGSTFLLSASGGSMVYYFKQTSQNYNVALKYVDYDNPNTVILQKNITLYGTSGSKKTVNASTYWTDTDGYKLYPTSQSKEQYWDRLLLLSLQ